MARTWDEKIADQAVLVRLKSLKVEKALVENDEPAFHKAVDELQAASTGLASLKGTWLPKK